MWTKFHTNRIRWEWTATDFESHHCVRGRVSCRQRSCFSPADSQLTTDSSISLPASGLCSLHPNHLRDVFSFVRLPSLLYPLSPSTGKLAHKMQLHSVNKTNAAHTDDVASRPAVTGLWSATLFICLHLWCYDSAFCVFMQRWKKGALSNKWGRVEANPRASHRGGMRKLRFAVKEAVSVWSLGGKNFSATWQPTRTCSVNKQNMFKQEEQTHEKYQQLFFSVITII